MILKTHDRDLRDAMIRRGFDDYGYIGDNHRAPKMYTLAGNINRLSQRQQAGLVSQKWRRKDQMGVPYVKSN